MFKNNKSLLFKTIKGIGIGIITILFLMFISPLIFADKIKSEIKKVANSRLNSELNYKDANVSFFQHFPYLTLSLSDFELNSSTPFQKEKLITADAVSFGINISKLIFSSTVKIDQIYLNKSSIIIKVNKLGEANYNVYKSTKNSSEKDSVSDTAIKLDKIVINNSQFIYDDQSTKIRIEAYRFNYVGNGDLDKNIFDLKSKAKIDKLNIIYQKEPYLMNKKVDADLITSININSLAFIFQENNLMINKLPVDFKGNFKFLKEGFDLNFIVKTTNSNLDELFSAFPPQYVTWLEKTELKGKTDFNFSLKGKYISSKNSAPTANLDLKIRDGFINYDKSKFPVTNLNLDLSTQLPSLNPDALKVNLKNLSLNLDKDYIKLKGRVNKITNPEIVANLDAEIDLEKLNRALGIPSIEIKGILMGKGISKGTFDPKKRLFPVTEATIDLRNGYLKTQYYPNPITNINIDGTIKNQKGTFDDLKIKLKPAEFTFENNPVFVTADLNNFDDLTYDITAKGLLNISKIYKVFSQKGLDIDGTIKADLALKGKQSDAEKGHYNKLNNKGVLELRNILLHSEYLPKYFLIKEGIFKINQDKMYFDNFLATYGQSDFKMDGYLENVFNYLTLKNGVLKGNFTLKSKFINVDEFMSTTTIPSNLPILKIETTPSFQEKKGVIMIPTNIDINFHAVAKNVHFDELKLKDASGNLKIQRGKINLQNTGFNLIGCTVTMNANYEGITTDKALFDYTIKATDFDIKRAYNEIKIFREMASAAEKAQGLISIDYYLKGKLNSNMEPIYPSLVGNGVISVKDIKLYGMKMFNAVSKKTNHEKINNPELSKVDIKTAIKNNIITIERFKFKYAGFRPRIEGQTTIDGKLNLKMRLGLPPLGIFGIPLTITGDKDHPKIKIGKQTEDLNETEDKD